MTRIQLGLGQSTVDDLHRRLPRVALPPGRQSLDAYVPGWQEFALSRGALRARAAPVSIRMMFPDFTDCSCRRLGGGLRCTSGTAADRLRLQLASNDTERSSIVKRRFGRYMTGRDSILRED